MDSNYETDVQPAVRPTSGPQPGPGYSYWSDGQGWQRTVGASAGSAGASGATDNEATAMYQGGPGFPGSSGYGGAAGYGGPGGYGNGGSGRQDWAGGLGGPGGPSRPDRFGGFSGPGGPRRPPGPRAKGKGDWWRHWTWTKAGILAGGIFVFVVIVMFGGYEYMYNTTTIPAALASETAQNSIVYYSNGTTEMGTIGNTNRQDLTLAQMGATDDATSPAVDGGLIDAFLAAEDKSFYTEGGISFTGILRALAHDVLTGGTDLNGGSTITEEYVKNVFGLGDEQTVGIKVKEIFIAQKLASSESKQEVLEGFLNTVGLGDNADGVQAAAETYFGKPAGQLTLAQDAILASMPQAPSELPLPSFKPGLKARWTYVLTHMYSDGFITQAQETAALKTFPTLLTWADPARAETAGNINPANPNNPWELYVLTQVEHELTTQDGFTQQQLNDGGYKIVTTLNKSMEQAMYKAVDTTLSSTAISGTFGSQVTSLPNWVLVGAQVQDPSTGAIVAEYPGKGQDVTAAECDGACELNTADETREQVGSSFKPYVLSAAVAQGMNVQTSTLDTSPYECVAPDLSGEASVPLTAAQYAADNANGKPDCSKTVSEGFPIENDGGEIIGTQIGTVASGGNKGAGYYEDNVQGALAASSNTGFTDLTHRAGTQHVINMAQDYGVNISPAADGGSGLSQMVGDTGLALGTASLTVQEQTTMLATLADNGLYHAAHIVSYWESTAPGSAEQKPKVASHIVLNQQQAGDVQYAMEATTFSGGTAFPSVTYGQTPGVIISKTGTTSDSKSGFFIGATTQYAMAVGMFTVDPSSPDNLSMLGGGGFGGYWPAKVWNTFANAEFSPDPTRFSTTPDTTGQTAWNMLGKPQLDCTQQGAQGNGKNGQNQNQNQNQFQLQSKLGVTCENQQNNNGQNQANGNGGNNGGGNNGGGFGGGFGGAPNAPAGGGGGAGANVVVALPGLLLTEASRRRGRKNSRGKAE